VLRGASANCPPRSWRAAAKSLALTALDLIQQPELLAEVRREFDEPAAAR
jgi:hypothetical protein